MTISIDPPADEHLRRARRPTNTAHAADRLVRIEILVTLILSVLMLFAIVRLAGRVYEDATPPSKQLPRGFAWAGRTFVDVGSFARWLRAQGFDYDVWARRHPRRAGIVAKLPPAPPKSARAARAAPADGDAGWAGWALAAGGIGFVTSAAAVALRRRWWQRIPRRRLPGPRLGASEVRRLTRLAVLASASVRVTARLVLRLAMLVTATAAAAARACARLASSERGELTLGTLVRFATRGRSGNLLLALRRLAARRRGDFVWYCAAAALAAGTGFAVAIWS